MEVNLSGKNTINVTGFAKMGLIRAIINIYKYNFEIFKSI